MSTNTGIVGSTFATRNTGPTPGTQVNSGSVNPGFQTCMNNWATLKLIFPNIYTMQMTGVAGSPGPGQSVNINLAGGDATYLLNVNLGAYAQIQVNGTGAGINLVSGLGMNVGAGQAVTVAGGGYITWQPFSEALWFYNAAFQSNTSAQFGNSVGITGAALGGSILTYSVPHTLDAGGDTIIIVGDGVDPSVNGVWYARPFQGSTTFFQINGGGGSQSSNGGIMAKQSFGITGTTNASPTVYTAPSHGLTTGESVLVTGITGNTGANTAGAAPATVIDANHFSLPLNTSAGGAYTGGGVGGVAVTGTITSVSGGNVIVTTLAPHTIGSGGYVLVDGVVGTFSPSLNTGWFVGAVDATHLVLFDSAPTGSYTSGGFVTPFDDEHGASVDVLRGGTTYNGTQIPPTAAPPANTQSAANLCSSRGSMTWTATLSTNSATVALSSATSGYNVKPLGASSINSSGNTSISLLWATPMAEDFYDCQIKVRDNSVLGVLLDAYIIAQSHAGLSFSVRITDKGSSALTSGSYLDLSGASYSGSGTIEFVITWSVHAPQ